MLPVAAIGVPALLAALAFVLTFETVPGEGTTFHVRLPIAGSALAAGAAA